MLENPLNGAVDEPTRRRRASSRLPIAVQVTLSGADPFGARWAEQAMTQKISKNGCSVLVYTTVAVGSVIEILGSHLRFPVKVRVVSVSETEDTEVKEIGLSFLEPVDFWGIRFPQDLPNASRQLPAGVGSTEGFESREQAPADFPQAPSDSRFPPREQPFTHTPPGAVPPAPPPGPAQPEYGRPSSSTFEIGQARQWQAGSGQSDYAGTSGPTVFGSPSIAHPMQSAPDREFQGCTAYGAPARLPRESNEPGALVSDIITRWFQQETITARERLSQAMQAQVEIQRRTLTDELREHVRSIQSTTQDELLEKVEELIDARLTAGETRLRTLISETRSDIAASEAQVQQMLSGVEERINQAIERGKAALAHSMSETQEKIRANLTSILLAELANKKNSMIAELGYELQSASKGAFREVLSTLNQVLSLAVDSVGTQPDEAEQSMSSASGQR